tara:strand:- start:63116 stop:63292 length:177 start_codon:yes stop_codon:yes gene_type:complete
MNNMGSNKIKAWALVDDKMNVVDMCFTRDDARHTKKQILEWEGIKTKIAKLAFNKFDR